MSKAAFRGLILAAVVAAAALRLGRLDLRPMHHDEANQAVKFGALLETGSYVYDKADHHGPTLYYLTLPVAWVGGQKTLSDLDETTLRLVPALFGIGLVGLFGLLGGAIGRRAAAAGALLTAASPALTYYSRSYIQEMIFAFFALGFLIAVGKMLTEPTLGRAAAAGLAAGLAFATKETSVLVFAAAAAGLLAAWAATCRNGDSAFRLPRPGHWGIAAGAAAAAAVLFFSSFFRNPKGILDALTAFKDYAARGTEAGVHSQPWLYYLKTLAGTRAEGTVWTEALILALALIGAAAAFIRISRKPMREETPADTDAAAHRFGRIYWAVTAVLLAAAFSALSYKTPWNLVPFLAGFCVLGGIGADALLSAVRSPAARTALTLLLFLGIAHLGRQSLAANFRYPADPRNPYVYAQTSPDFLRLVDRVRDLASVHRDGRSMLIKVIAEPDSQWPLPWYLRSFARVGYWATLAEANGVEGVPVVIASQRFADVIEASQGAAFQSAYYGLRPEVVLTLFVDRALLESFLDSRMRR